MKNGKYMLVWALTSLRILFALFFAWLFINGLNIEAIMAFIFSILTDALDGYFSRRFDVSTAYGAYFDIFADFFLVFVAFTLLIFEGIYPLWLLFLITVVFVQFIVTSKFKFLVYDPLGKYYGSFLFIMILITLFSPDAIYKYLLFIIVLFTLISLISRYIFFILKKRNK